MACTYAHSSSISVIKMSHSKLRNPVFFVTRNCHDEGSLWYFSWVSTDVHASATPAFLLRVLSKNPSSKCLMLRTFVRHKNYNCDLIAGWQNGPNTDQSGHKASLSGKSMTGELLYALNKTPSAGSLSHFNAL